MSIGETYNGHLVNCDPWMNIMLTEVIKTAADGAKFWRIAEAYIRGSNVKYLRVPDEVLDLVSKEQLEQQAQRSQRGTGGNPSNQNRRGGNRGGQRGGNRGSGRGSGRGNGRGGYQKDRQNTHQNNSKE